MHVIPKQMILVKHMNYVMSVAILNCTDDQQDQIPEFIFLAHSTTQLSTGMFQMIVVFVHEPRKSFQNVDMSEVPTEAQIEKTGDTSLEAIQAASIIRDYILQR